MKISLSLIVFLCSYNILLGQDITSFKKQQSKYLFRSIGHEDFWNWRENRFPVLIVSKREKWGFIDTTGKKVIPFKYDYAGKFSSDLALVKFKGKYGFINKKGKVITSFQFDDAGPFINGIVTVANYNHQGNEKKLKWIMIDTNGKVITK